MPLSIPNSCLAAERHSAARRRGQTKTSGPSVAITCCAGRSGSIVRALGRKNRIRKLSGALSVRLGKGAIWDESVILTDRQKSNFIGNLRRGSRSASCEKASAAVKEA